MNSKHQKKYLQLGLNIAYWRKMAGITQLELAEKAGISRTYVSQIEAPNMTTTMSLEKVFDIADALGISAEKIFDFR
jgi:transcriptional regulator with XRE-family HTH domain